MCISGRWRDALPSPLLGQQHSVCSGKNRSSSSDAARTSNNPPSNGMIRLGNTSSYRVPVVSLRHPSARFVALVACWCCCLSIDFHTSFSEISQQYQKTSAAEDVFLTQRQQQHQGVTALFFELSPLPYIRGAAAIRGLTYAVRGGAEGAALSGTNKSIVAAKEAAPASRAGEIRRPTHDGSAPRSSEHEDATLVDTRHKQHGPASEARAAQDQHMQKRPEGEEKGQLQEGNETHENGSESGGAQKHTQTTQEAEDQPHKDEGKEKKKFRFGKFLRNATEWILGKRPIPGAQKELQHAKEKTEDQKQLYNRDGSAAERERSTGAETASTGATHTTTPSAAGASGRSSYLEAIFPYPRYMTGAAKRWEKRARAEGMIRGPRRSRSAVKNAPPVALGEPSFALLQAPAAVPASPSPDGTDSDVDLTVAHNVEEERKELHGTAAFNEERERSRAAETTSTGAILAAPLSAAASAGAYPHRKAAFPYMGITAKGWGEKARAESIISGPTRRRSTAGSRYSVALRATSSTAPQASAGVFVVIPSAGAAAADSVSQSSAVHGASRVADVHPAVAQAVRRRLAAAGDQGEGKDDDRGWMEKPGVSMLTQPQERAEQGYVPTAVVTENMNLEQPDSETLDLFLPETSRSRVHRRRRRGRQYTEEASFGSRWGPSRWNAVAGAAGGKEMRMPSVLTQSAARADTASQGLQSSGTTGTAVTGSGSLWGRGLGNVSGRRFTSGSNSELAGDRDGAAGGARFHSMAHESWRKWDDHASDRSEPVTSVRPPQPTSWAAPSRVGILQTTSPAALWDGKESRLTGIPRSNYLSGGASSASRVELARQRHYQESVLNEAIGAATAITGEVERATAGAPHIPPQRTAMPNFPLNSVVDIGLSSEEAPQYNSGSRGTQLQAGPFGRQQAQQQLGGEVNNLLLLPVEERQQELGSSPLQPGQMQSHELVLDAVGQLAKTSNPEEVEEEKEMQRLLRQKYIAQPLRGKQRLLLAVRIVLNLMSVVAMAVVAAMLMDRYSELASVQYMMAFGLAVALLGERVLRGLQDVWNSGQLLVQDVFLRGERQHVVAVAEAIKTIQEQEEKAKSGRRSSEEGGADVYNFGEKVNSPSDDDEVGMNVDDSDLQGGSPWL